jgi:hypothetical protein
MGIIFRRDMVVRSLFANGKANREDDLRSLKQANVALEPLAEVTEQRSPFMASPLQALVRLRSENASLPIAF